MHDYTGHEEEIAPDQMVLLQNLVKKLGAAEEHVEALESQLEQAKTAARQLRENDIPELMQAVGIKQLTTDNGLEVKLREEVRASFFAKDPTKREPAYAWLKEHRHDGLVKNTVSVALNRQQEDLAEKVVAALKSVGVPLNIERKKEINHQTLLAFLRERLREGDEVPLPLFGAFVQKFADVKRGK